MDAHLEDLGWLVNYEKSILTPDKIIKWVGVVIDFDRYRWLHLVRPSQLH